nr:MAG: ORF1 [TTV-like mini virus]
MPPFRRRYYKRNFYKPRRWFRRWRSGKTLRRKRRRRRTRVRRRRFKNFKKYKLKFIKLTQWQPSHIKNCKIKGTIQLFQAGIGRFSHNYSLFKDSWVPEHEPGGGGWCYLQLSLGNLYTEHQRLQNWWTRSNQGLNLCRYRGVRLRFWRQQFTDYIVTYSNEYPMEVGKFHYPSMHPQRLMLYNHRIVVPSYNSMPHKKKAFKQVFVKPPKEMVDKWYFQQHFQRFPLVLIAASACSLEQYYISDQVISNNITLYSLDTKLIHNKNFQRPSQTTGWYPKEGQYLYATYNGTTDFNKIQPSTCTYLGNTVQNTPGSQGKQTTFKDWGSPFFKNIIDGTRNVILTTKNNTDFWTQTTPIEGAFIDRPIAVKCRYNPTKDDGIGNEAYWVSNFSAENNWEWNNDPDIHIQGFPLWLMLWGWYDWSRNLNKIKNIYNDYLLVVKSRYLTPALPAYVFLNESYIEGSGPYNTNLDELDPSIIDHWYPQWKFQQEAIETLLMCGTGVCRGNHTKQIQAHCDYSFFFKWGGNPASMEKVIDPTTQPQYPLPSGQFLSNEIIDPSTSIYNYLYNFDQRRDLLTQTAEKRIKQISDFDPSLFTDGILYQSINPPAQGQETAPPFTTEEEEKTPILQQLQQLQQFNQQLLQRYRQLTLQIQNSQ